MVSDAPPEEIMRLAFHDVNFTIFLYQHRELHQHSLIPSYEMQMLLNAGADINTQGGEYGIAL